MVISVEQGADDMLMSLPSHCLFLHSSAEWFNLLLLVYPSHPERRPCFFTRFSLFRTFNSCSHSYL